MSYRKQALALLFLALPTLGLAQESYSIFLVGDAGEPTIVDSEQLNLLQTKVREAPGKTAVIFLGDNIYPKGMPDEEEKYRETAEQIICSQLASVKGVADDVYVIPGNHDWEKGKKDGYRINLNQEEFVEDFMDSLNVYLPDNGCPGPVEVPLREDLLLVIMDTQWLLHPWAKPQRDQGCQVSSEVEVLNLLEDILQRNRHKKVIVAAHHPVITYGIHGGVANAKDHIFPLTAASDNLYIPLPIIGSIYPFYRKYVGSIQVIAHPSYRYLRNHLMDLYQRFPGLVHVSGHEHSLQHNVKDSVHYVVSGSAVKTTFAKEKGYSQFARDKVGFGQLDYEPDGTARLIFWAADGEKLYDRVLFKRPYLPPKTISYFQNLDLKDSTVVASASQQYLIEPSRYWFLGKNYREVWATDVEAPVFDIGTEKGGLEIIQRGGGMQTKSLRLENPDGKQYVIRSIEKYAEKAIPEQFRGTFAGDLVQDQISSSHPYGAFAVPYLAEAAEIYHTNPRLKFVPDDPRLGEYRSDFANTLVLFEERPAGNRKDVESFGRSKKIYNTADVIKQIKKDNDNRVDQDWVLKSRLFDLYIGDWDRHDDQWRWASFKEKKGRMFRPIPRDRDNAFFISEGTLMSVVKKKWAMPKFQGFDYELKNPSGFMFNARFFDRDFLSEKDGKEWEQAIRDLQGRMTDEVIESAIKTWPDSVYQLSGETIISKLKARRSRIEDWAMDYYHFLSKKVDVHGSNKKEYFHIERLNEDATKVRVYKKTDDDDKEKLIYQRTFLYDETKEIRLYGLKGADEFKVEGDVSRGIKLRIIGGPGKDEITDESRVKGWSKKTIVYDKKGTKLNLGKEARDRTSENKNVNTYDRQDFKYNFTAPLLFFNYNVDDRVFFGAGLLATTHGFRKDPFQSQHFLLGSVAPATQSWDFRYKGVYTGIFRKIDFKLNAVAQSPNYTTNFFGLGNNTVFDRNIDQTVNVSRAIDYYRVRYQHYSIEALLSRRLGEKAEIDAGFHWQAFDTEDDYGVEDRSILDFAQSTGDSSIFEWKTYQGVMVKLLYDSRNSKVLPTRGIVWNVDLRSYVGLNNASNRFARLMTDVTFNHAFFLPNPLAFALRIGGGQNYGSYEYYQAQILSGPTELRGFRKTRFLGDRRAFLNAEVRYPLVTIATRTLPSTLGFNAFYDTGRVWLEGENSNTWHRGFGGGIWIAPLNAAVLAFEVGSGEETRLFIRLGFMF